MTRFRGYHEHYLNKHDNLFDNDQFHLEQPFRVRVQLTKNTQYEIKLKTNETFQ